MTTLMDLRCFMCRDRITYVNNDISDFSKHMSDEHIVDFGIEFLLAACLMENEERDAIRNVIGDKFQVGEKYNDLCEVDSTSNISNEADRVYENLAEELIQNDLDIFTFE